MTAGAYRVSFRGDQSVLKVAMVTQPCKCPKDVLVEWVNRTACQLHLSRPVGNTKSTIEACLSL